MRYNTGTSLYKALVWLLFISIFAVQFNGHIHRVEHTDFSNPLTSWIDAGTTAEKATSTVSNYHHCALLDALSLGSGPVGSIIAAVPVVLPNLLSVSVAATPSVGSNEACLPPVRAPPLFA